MVRVDLVVRVDRVVLQVCNGLGIPGLVNPYHPIISSKQARDRGLPGFESVTRTLQYYAWQRPKSIDRLSETRTKVFLLYYEGLYFIGLSRLSWFNMATMTDLGRNYYLIQIEIAMKTEEQIVYCNIFN